MAGVVPCAYVIDPVRVGGHMGRALRELHQHGTQKRRGDPHQSRDVRAGSDRPDVSQCLRPVAADGRRRSVFPEDAARRAGAVHGDGGPDESAIRGGDRALRQDRRRGSDHVREGPAEGRRGAAVPRDIHARRRRAVRRQGAREGQRVPHREAAGRARRLPVDHPLDRDGQSLLRLPRRPGLRPALHQVLLLLSLPREALSERARVVETAAHAAGGPVRAVGQWHPLERPGRPRAAHRRHARRRQDRRGLPQVVASPPASVRRCAPGGRLSVPALDPAGRVRADPGPRSAAAPGAASSKKSSARISTSGGPIRCS